MLMHEHDQRYIADTARVMGEVELGTDVGVWFGALIRGDVAKIVIGDNTNVQDNVTIHCDHGKPNIIGANVTIGHNAVVHGQAIGDGSLIGMHATVLGRTRIGRNCLIAAGAVVPPGLEVPDGMVVMGVPGKVRRETTEEEREYMKFLPQHYVKLAQRHCREPEDARVKQWAGN